MITQIKNRLIRPSDPENSRTYFEWNMLGSLGFGLIFVLLIFWNTCHVWAMIYDMNMNDFGKFYYATVAFLHDQNMYGPNPATYIQVTDDYGRDFWNLNPPHFHLLILPLAILPPYIALGLWGIANFVALFVGLNWIQEELRLTPTHQERRWLTLGFLAFAGTGAHFVTGQLSFLLVLPVTLAWIHARHHRWINAGLCLGIACSIKLFLLIFIPFLILQRQFRALAGFLAVLFTTFGVGFSIFGTETHLSWIGRLSEVDWHWASMNASLLGSLSRILTENPMYQAAFYAENLIYPLWILASTILALVTFTITTGDSSSHQIDRSFAILITSAILISPLGWTYYIFLLLGPLTSIVYQWNSQFRLNGTKKNIRLQQLQMLTLYGAIPGSLVPLVTILLFEPNSFVSLTVGSAYFWSILSLWIFLVINWRLNNTEWGWRQLVRFNNIRTVLHSPSKHTQVSS